MTDPRRGRLDPRPGNVAASGGFGPDVALADAARPDAPSPSPPAGTA